MNKLALSLIAKRADPATLTLLSQVPEWKQTIDIESSSNHSWYERTLTLLNFEVPYSNTNWQQVYRVINEATSGSNPFSYEGELSKPENEFNLVAVNILLRLGFDPNADGVSLLNAVRYGTLEAVELLLSYEAVRNNPRQIKSAISAATRLGDIESVSILLASSLLSSSDINSALVQAVKGNSVELVSLLLQDERVDPNDDDMMVVQTAAYNPNYEVVARLVADSRVVVTKESVIAAAGNNPNPKILELLLNKLKQRGLVDTVLLRRTLTTAATSGQVDNVAYLLAQPNVNPTAYESSVFIKAVDNARVEVVRLLLEDGRVDPATKNDLALKTAIGLLHLPLIEVLLSDDRVDIYGDVTREWLLDPASLLPVAVPLVRLLGSDYRAFANVPDYVVKYAREQSSSTGHYDLLLREILAHRPSFVACLDWLIEQQNNSNVSMPSRKLVQRAAKSLLLKYALNHYDNQYFTAYRGLFLLMKISNAKSVTIKNAEQTVARLQNEVAVSADGLLKAKMLMYALIAPKLDVS